MSKIDLELLEAYLEGKLPADQQEQVKKLVAQDQATKEKLELLKLSRTAIELDSWSQLISQTQKNYLRVREKQTKPRLGFSGWASRIAASLAFFIIASILILLSATSPDSLVENYGSYQIPIMRDEETTLTKLENAYTNKNWQSIEMIKDQKTSFDFNSLFLFAMADLQNGNPKSAEEQLEHLMAKNEASTFPLFADEIDYYLIQALLLQKKYEEAEPKVKELLQNPAHRYSKNFTTWDLWKIKILDFKNHL